MGNCSGGSCSGCACGGGASSGLGGDPRLGRDGVWRFYRDESLGAADGTWSVGRKDGAPIALIRCISCGRLFIVGSKHSIKKLDRPMYGEIDGLITPDIKCPGCKWKGSVALTGWKGVK